MPGIEPRALYILGKYSTIELHLQPRNLFLYTGDMMACVENPVILQISD